MANRLPTRPRGTNTTAHGWASAFGQATPRSAPTLPRRRGMPAPRGPTDSSPPCAGPDKRMAINEAGRTVCCDSLRVSTLPGGMQVCCPWGGRAIPGAARGTFRCSGWSLGNLLDGPADETELARAVLGWPCRVLRRAYDELTAMLIDVHRERTKGACRDLLAQITGEQWADYAAQHCGIDLSTWDGSLPGIIYLIAGHMGLVGADGSKSWAALREEIGAKMAGAWFVLEVNALGEPYIDFDAVKGPCGLDGWDTWEIPGAFALADLPGSSPAAVGYLNGKWRDKWFRCHPDASNILLQKGCDPSWDSVPSAFEDGFSIPQIFGFPLSGTFLPWSTWSSSSAPDVAAAGYQVLRLVLASALARGCAWPLARLEAAGTGRPPFPLCLDEAGPTLMDAGTPCNAWVAQVFEDVGVSTAEIPSCPF